MELCRVERFLAHHSVECCLEQRAAAARDDLRHRVLEAQHEHLARAVEELDRVLGLRGALEAQPRLVDRVHAALPVLAAKLAADIAPEHALDAFQRLPALSTLCAAIVVVVVSVIVRCCFDFVI